MKTHLSIFAVIFFALLITFSCKKEAPKVIPSIYTSAPTNITSSTATCGGAISADGGAPVTSRGVCWSVIQNPTTSDNKTSDGSGIGSFTSSISELTPGTEYYVRAYATNSVGTAYGNQVVSTTMSTLPTITTSTVTNITTTTALSGGFISFEGVSPVISRGVCWSTSQNPTITDSKTSNGTGSSSFVSSITGLSPGTTYYIRAYATSSMGTAYGSQLSFTTGVEPVAAFTAIPTTITVGQSVQFTDQSTNTPSSWSWDFGDGGKSTTQNPSHTYETASLYTVGLYVTNKFGDSHQMKKAYITVNPVSVGIDFNPNLTYGSVTDIDGNVYKTIQIGTQTWMAENLKTTKFSNGDLIGTTTPATLDITTEIGPIYQWAFAGSESNVAIFGRLYTWHAATDNRNVCPNGWHAPTDQDRSPLTTYLGGESIAGGKLKETGTGHWKSPNTDATNSSGFTALPGGYRTGRGVFTSIGKEGHWWPGDWGFSTDRVWSWDMSYNSGALSKYTPNWSDGYSVRCLKDN